MIFLLFYLLANPILGFEEPFKTLPNMQVMMGRFVKIGNEDENQFPIEMMRRRNKAFDVNSDYAKISDSSGEKDYEMYDYQKSIYRDDRPQMMVRNRNMEMVDKVIPVPMKSNMKLVPVEMMNEMRSMKSMVMGPNRIMKSGSQMDNMRHGSMKMTSEDQVTMPILNERMPKMNSFRSKEMNKDSIMEEMKGKLMPERSENIQVMKDVDNFQYVVTMEQNPKPMPNMNDPMKTSEFPVMEYEMDSEMLDQALNPYSVFTKEKLTNSDDNSMEVFLSASSPVDMMEKVVFFTENEDIMRQNAKRSGKWVEVKSDHEFTIQVN